MEENLVNTIPTIADSVEKVGYGLSRVNITWIEEYYSSKGNYTIKITASNIDKNDSINMYYVLAGYFRDINIAKINEILSLAGEEILTEEELNDSYLLHNKLRKLYGHIFAVSVKNGNEGFPVVDVVKHLGYNLF